MFFSNITPFKFDRTSVYRGHSGMSWYRGIPSWTKDALAALDHAYSDDASNYRKQSLPLINLSQLSLVERKLLDCHDAVVAELSKILSSENMTAYAQ